MGAFVSWKFAVDIALGMVALICAFRMLRSGVSGTQLRQLGALEEGMRTLIREAELAGSSLNDQLLRRQQALEGLLKDFEDHDGRLKRACAESAEVRHELERFSRQARDESRDLERLLVRAQAIRETHTAQMPPVSPQPTAAHDSRWVEPAPQQQHPAAPSRQGSAAASAQSSRVNIFGDPIDESAVPSTAQDNSYQPLSQIVERLADKPREITSRHSIEIIERAAEHMLRAGRSLEAVAAATMLPIEKIRGLARQAVQKPTLEAEIVEEVDDRPIVSAKADPRLGALGSMRRQTQVL